MGVEKLKDAGTTGVKGPAIVGDNPDGTSGIGPGYSAPASFAYMATRYFNDYKLKPDEGKKLKAGKKFAKMESGKWLGKVFAPVNGELAEVNEDLEINPNLINDDCYGEGWMYKIKPDDKAEIQNLIHGPEAVEKWVLADIVKYSEE